jgi:chemotaxis protein MotB
MSDSASIKVPTVAERLEHTQLQNLKRNRIWLLTFVSLFTSLLAFFVLIITMVELEGIGTKRSYQKLVNNLYKEILNTTQSEGLVWLHTENTLTKGIRLHFDTQLFESTPLFAPARTNINPRYYPYLNEVARVLKQIDLANFAENNPKWNSYIRAAGMQVDLTLRIEGHTDSIPLDPNARFRNNIELSSLRAYEVMMYLQPQIGLDFSYFSIAGYGSFHPIVADPRAAENRRIELYLVPVLRPISRPAEVQG